MTLKLEKKIPDLIPDEAGQLLRSMQAIPTWTRKKFELYAAFEKLADRQGYLFFTADRRDYHLERKGEHCLFDVPLGQRGALQQLAGKRIRLVCGGSFNPYSNRIYFAKVVEEAVG